MNDPTNQVDPKTMARALRTALAERGVAFSHSETLELIARAHGHRDWNTMAALQTPRTATGRPNEAIPILRIFEQAKAYEFYRDFLGFHVAWEHRFGEHQPLYAEIVYDGIRLHLSEHYGDASPGGAVIVEIDDAHAFQRRLVSANYDYAKPAVSQEDWGLVVTVNDPFHNRLMFAQRPARAERVVEIGSPIVHEVIVPAPPTRAFEGFTQQLVEWWDPRLTADAATFCGAELGPGPGGDVIFRHTDGVSYRIGSVSEWRPGQRFAMSFCLAMDPAHPTTLSVDFAAVGEGTRVRLTHAGWGPGNVAERAKFTEWPGLLQRYHDHVRSQANP